MNTKGVGPQGLGNKSNNGFRIAPSTKQGDPPYKKATDKFEGFNQVTDTVTMRRGPNITSAMEGTSDETYFRFKGKQPTETKYTQSNDGSITAYSLRKKPTTPAKKKIGMGIKRSSKSNVY